MSNLLDQKLENREAAERNVKRLIGMIKLGSFAFFLGLVGIVFGASMTYGGPSPIHTAGNAVCAVSVFWTIFVVIGGAITAAFMGDKKIGLFTAQEELRNCQRAYRQELNKIGDIG